ncbi:MAG: protease complex subunit PrcB family protein [Chloroflexi bacterium]|nr:protease complex subunit PrcB family protein [Chloroflexota bacterium]
MTNSVEASQLESLISERGRDALRQVNYQTDMVIGVFQGLKPTDGYMVQIERITAYSATFTITAQFIEPSPDEKKNDVVTSPYHVVRVSKPEVTADELTFVLVVSDTVILSTTHRLSE